MASQSSMKSAIREISRGKTLINLLHSHPDLHTEATDLTKGIQRALASALSILEHKESTADADIVSGKKRPAVTGSSGDREERVQKKKKPINPRTIIVTPAPHHDGHQWRKYGQKMIHNSKHPRSYYRCTYRDEQGCLATKQVQQEECDDSQLFKVIYNNQHTCNPPMLDTTPQIILNSSSKESNLLIFESKGSYTESSNTSKPNSLSPVIDLSEENLSSLSEKCSSLIEENIEEDMGNAHLLDVLPIPSWSTSNSCGLDLDDIDSILSLLG